MSWYTWRFWIFARGCDAGGNFHDGHGLWKAISPKSYYYIRVSNKPCEF